MKLQCCNNLEIPEWLLYQFNLLSARENLEFSSFSEGEIAAIEFVIGNSISKQKLYEELQKLALPLKHSTFISNLFDNYPSPSIYRGFYPKASINKNELIIGQHKILLTKEVAKNLLDNLINAKTCINEIKESCELQGNK